MPAIQLSTSLSCLSKRFKVPEVKQSYQQQVLGLVVYLVSADFAYPGVGL